MTNTKRLDRLIVRLCYVRNLITRFDHQIDFDLDLHDTETAVDALYETAHQQSEEISHDNARD